MSAVIWNSTGPPGKERPGDANRRAKGPESEAQLWFDNTRVSPVLSSATERKE
jgi:hypothetical protein